MIGEMLVDRLGATWKITSVKRHAYALSGLVVEIGRRLERYIETASRCRMHEPPHESDITFDHHFLMQVLAHPELDGFHAAPPLSHLNRIKTGFRRQARFA